MDSKTTIAELKDQVTRFRDAREWGKFNDVKSLAEALVIESGELLEIFLWKDKETISEALKSSPKYREALSDEVADVFIYLLQLVHDSGVDLSEAVAKKMEKNARKYPVEEWKGKMTKYTA